MRIAVGRRDLENTIANLQGRNIERAATEVIHSDLLILLLVQAISQRSGSRLVDDAQDIQTRNFPGILCRVALRIVEIGRNRDDCLSDFSPSFASASALSFPRIIAEISGGLKRFLSPLTSTSMWASPLARLQQPCKERA